MKLFIWKEALTVTFLFILISFTVAVLAAILIFQTDKKKDEKEFPITIFFTWRFYVRLIITISFIIRYYFIFHVSENMVYINDLVFNVFVFFLLILMWFIYLNKPYKILIDGNKINFKFAFKTIPIDVNSLISIKDVCVGWITRFNSEKNCVTTLPTIIDRTRLFNHIKSLNPSVKIDEATRFEGCLSKFVRFSVVMMVLFFIIFSYPMGRNRSPGFNRFAYSDLKNAYTAAQAYFTDYHDGIITRSILEKYGFAQTEGVQLTILSGTKYDLRISTTHPKGNKIYEIDSKGKYTFRKKELRWSQ